MTFFRKFLPKIIVSTVILIFLIIAPFTVFTKLNVLNYSLNKEYKFDYQGVLNLWNVDTFEGGSVSRTVFLEKRAQEFEKKNKGVYICVQNISLEQLKLNLSGSKKPDLITFGVGVEDEFCDQIIDFQSGFGVRDDLLNSSKINGKIKAIPIMLGGYTLIFNKEKIADGEILNKLNEENLIFSSTQPINPLLALFVNNIMPKNQQIEQLDSFDAYGKFINEKYNILLGTQRDFYRCRNRENSSKMQCDYNILGGFSDLIQYVSVFKSDEKTEEICKKFVEFLTSESVQCKLENINMFPVINKNIYTDEFYKKYNEILLKPLKTLNVFIKQNELDNLKELVFDYIFNGKISNKIEILKFLNN